MIELNKEFFDDIYSSIHFEYKDDFEAVASKWEGIFSAACYNKDDDEYPLGYAKLALSLINQIIKLDNKCHMKKKELLLRLNDMTASECKDLIVKDSIESAFYLSHVSSRFAVLQEVVTTIKKVAGNLIFGSLKTQDTSFFGLRNSGDLREQIKSARHVSRSILGEEFYSESPELKQHD